MSLGKRIVFWLVLLSIPLVAIEIGFRLYFARAVGPDVLGYGFLSDARELHRVVDDASRAREFKRLEGSEEWQSALFASDDQGSYAKYAPHQVRYSLDHETRERFRIGINSRGFRGPEFDEEKPPGTIRVVTLGASSTLGIFDRDDETYPRYLEQMLNERCPADLRFEVINLGIPHTRSHQNVALFRAEALPLDPDVVTFYEGANDTFDHEAMAPEGADGGGMFSRVLQVLRKSLLSVAFLDFVGRSEVRLVEATADQLERHAEATSEHLLASLAEIHEDCRDRGILFVVANQQARTPTTPRHEVRGVTMDEEARGLRIRLERKGVLRGTWSINFLTHVEVMKRLERWATANGIPFVDVVGALDQDRDVLLSWVHLSPEGNRVIARELAGVILEATCPPGR